MNFHLKGGETSTSRNTTDRLILPWFRFVLRCKSGEAPPNRPTADFVVGGLAQGLARGVKVYFIIFHGLSLYFMVNIP